MSMTATGASTAGKLFEFLKETQPEKYETILKRGEDAFLKRLAEQIRKRGVIDVLRKGVKDLDLTVQALFQKAQFGFEQTRDPRLPGKYFRRLPPALLQQRQPELAGHGHLPERPAHYHL